MATKTINVDVLAKMFLAGAQNIEAKKDYINELNVFPVPDGDTGTNMSMTIIPAGGRRYKGGYPARQRERTRLAFQASPGR